MKSLFDFLDENEIEPNQLYVLFCIKEKKQAKINIFLPVRGLLDKKFIVSKDVANTGYLLEQYLLTQEGENVLEQVGHVKTTEESFIKGIVKLKDVTTKAEQYNELFPRSKAGSGSYMRSNPKDVGAALSWFMINYPYNWDTIIKATCRYLDEEEAKGFKYTSTSRYFIKKMDGNRTITSKLADWCEIIKNGEDIIERPNFSDKVV